MATRVGVRRWWGGRCITGPNVGGVPQVEDAGGARLVELGRDGKARDGDELDVVVAGFRFEGKVPAVPREVSWSAQR